jgi:hypothetical protein
MLPSIVAKPGRFAGRGLPVRRCSVVWGNIRQKLRFVSNGYHRWFCCRSLGADHLF